MLKSDYTVEQLKTEIPVAEYIAGFRDADKFIRFCRECPSYGASWGCPPFEFDAEALLRRYERAIIFASKIVPADPLPLSEVQNFIRPERMEIERRLLDLERETGGRAFAYVGRCLYCGDEPCARLAKLPCRHPDKVRPSLEAFGFDIAGTLDRLFGIELKWGRDGYAPDYLVLVSALFVPAHNTAATSLKA